MDELLTVAQVKLMLWAAWGVCMACWGVFMCASIFIESNEKKMVARLFAGSCAVLALIFIFMNLCL